MIGIFLTFNVRIELINLILLQVKLRFSDSIKIKTIIVAITFDKIMFKYFMFLKLNSYGRIVSTKLFKIVNNNILRTYNN